jgi:hypothetical protein
MTIERVNWASETSQVSPLNHTHFELERNHQDLKWIVLMIQKDLVRVACPSFTLRFLEIKKEQYCTVITQKLLLFRWTIRTFETWSELIAPKRHHLIQIRK